MFTIVVRLGLRLRRGQAPGIADEWLGRDIQHLHRWTQILRYGKRLAGIAGAQPEHREYQNRWVRHDQR